MNFRPSLCHQCFDQNRVYTFVEPFLSAQITKADLVKLWNDAAKVLGQVRPKTCRCSYRVSTAEADHLVQHGLASYLITEWRYNEDKKVFFPAPNPNLVWGGKQAEELGLVRSSLAQKTPRVQTIEKAHIERGIVDGNQEDLDRIEEWGRLQKKVWDILTVTYWPEPFDPFRGCPVLSVPPGWDQRTCIGKSLDK